MLVELENLNSNLKLLTPEFKNSNHNSDHLNFNLNNLKKVELLLLILPELILQEVIILTLFHHNTHHLHHQTNTVQQALHKELLMELAQLKNQAMEELQELPQPPALINLDHHIRPVEEVQLELPQLQLVLQELTDHMDQHQELDQELEPLLLQLPPLLVLLEPLPLLMEAEAVLDMEH
jgi:hypothetical protein